MLKNKLLFRRLALALCLSLIVGIMPITALSVPVARDASAPSTNLLVNGDFENGTTGWSNASVLTSWSEEKHGGSYSMKFTDNNDTAAGPYVQQPVTVEAGKTYTLSAWVKVLEGRSGYIGVYGISSSSAQVSAGSAGDWKKIEVTVTIPEEKTEALIQFGTNSGSNTNFLIDDMVFAEVVTEGSNPTDSTEASESTEATESVVIFSDFMDGSAVPDVSAEQWKEFDGNAETVLTKESSAYKVGRGGNNKLVFQGGTTNVQYYAKSPVIAVTGGKTYTVAYEAQWHFNNLSANALFELVFVDAEGNVLDSVTDVAYDVASTSATWAAKSHSGVAPASAVGAYLKFNYKRTSQFDYWIRNLTVTETETPAPAAPNHLVNGNFEQGTTAWQNVQIADGAGRTGAALKLDATVKGRDLETAAADRVSVTAGESYDFSFYAKRDAADASGNKFTAYVLWYNASGTYMTGKANYWQGLNPTTDWGQFEYTVTAPEGAAAAAVRFYGDSSFNGVIYIDDVVFYDAAPVEPDPTETTAATEATGATENTEPSGPKTLVNGDFENGTTGWSNTSVLTSWSEEKHGGSYSIKFTDNNDTAAGPYVQQPVTVEAGKTYTLSAWVKVLEGNSGYIGVYGISSSSAQVSAGSAGDWKKIEVTVTIPEEKTEALIQFGTNSGSNTNFLIDDMTFVEVVTEETQPTESTGSTESTNATEGTNATESTEATQPGYIFSDFFASTGVPGTETWVESNGDGEIALESAHISVKRGTDNKLVFQAPVKNVHYYAKSPLIPITGGMTYTADYQASWYFNSNAEDSIELIFVDAQGNVLATESADAFKTSAAQTDWHNMSFSAVAPAEAVGMYIKFNYCVTTGSNNYWLKNLTITETETPVIPTEPYDPNLMLSENFEVFADPQYPNSGPFGWISSDDAGSVYSVAVACAQRESIKIDGYYLLLQMTGNWIAQSPSFAVKPGYEYTADFVARKMENNEYFNGYLTICFVDMFDLVLKADKVTIGETYGRWAEETVKAVAPAGAVKAYLVFGIDNDNRRIKADYAVDNLTVMQSEEAVVAIAPVPDIPTNTIFEDNFQNYFTPEGSANSVRVPNGWTASANSAALSCAKYDDYDGTTNLCLQNLDDKWIRTPELDAVAGYTYTAVFMEKKLNPAAVGTGGYAKLVFVNSKGDVIAEVTEEIGQAERWTRNGIQAVAPAGAAKFYLEIGIANGKGSHVSYSIDDLQIIEAQGNTLLSNGGTGNVETNPATGDNAALILVSTLMVMTVALAVVVIKKRRFF